MCMVGFHWSTVPSMSCLVDRINQDVMTFFSIFDYTDQNKSGNYGVEKVEDGHPSDTHTYAPTQLLEK